MTKNDYNIILEITVLPNSGTGAFIENVSGVSNYGQTELLIKRNASMVVTGTIYNKKINGVEKTIIPVSIKK